MTDDKAAALSRIEAAREKILDCQERSMASRAAGLCVCHRCLKERDEMRVFMVVCHDCGNKRRPKAIDHNLACTNSNEPGQIGSVYR